MGNKISTNFEYDDFLELIKDQNKQQQTHSQQNLLQQFQCRLLNHKNKSIDGICINENCKQHNRRICFDCIIDKLHDKDNWNDSFIRNADQINEIILKFKRRNIIFTTNNWSFATKQMKNQHVLSIKS